MEKRGGAAVTAQDGQALTVLQVVVVFVVVIVVVMVVPGPRIV